ncbi:hypothetical protein FB451DRAFT_1414540 [Mycena latifolia]|nr:hypothetical protein FB451DRAFT_1414540 [Mycena latifolia]
MSSPFTSKLGTNYCPQDEEISQIQTLLVEPTLRLKCLDDEIAVLQKALDKLAEERAGISAYEIFTACLPTHRNCAMSAVEAPVLLGRICSSWRSISLSTPRLWSWLHIVEPSCPFNTPYWFEKKLAQRLETTKMWLGRSGNCPLSISLQSSGNSYPWGSQSKFIPALLPFASRWERISFTAPAPLSNLGIVSHLTEADVPMLKSVSISTTYGNEGNAVRLDSFGFLRAPEISSFSLKGGSFNPIELPLHWGSLINLSITETQGFPASETALQILSRCPQLRTCRLLVHDPPDIGDIVSGGLEEPVLELSFLHTLDLGCDAFQTVYRLFGWVFFPQLRNLKLRGMSDNENMPYVRFLAAAPLIEKLEISNVWFSKPFLVSFLRELPPTLRQLNISIDFPAHYPASFDDEILESFIPSVDLPTPCCPGLQALEIQYSCAISDKALLRFRTLKCVVICFNRAMELDIRPELQSLVKNGLHLALTYNPPVHSFSPWEGLPDAPNSFFAP